MTDRRPLPQTAAALLSLVVAAGQARTQTEPVRPRPPNVLFVAIDDLNDWVGVLDGNPQSKTPNLDRLARRGILFTNAHCAAPACNPSRAALMTGIAPHVSGVYYNNQPWRRALADAATLPQHLRAHGYTTLGSGKIFHGAFPDPDSWDEYWPSKRQQRPADPVPDKRPVNGIRRTAHFDWGPLDVSDAQMGDAQVASWIVGQLQKRHEKPFFLACGFFRPHLPWYVPRAYFEQYPLAKIELPRTRADDLDDIPEAGRRIAKPGGDHAKVVAHDQWKQAVQGYLASIAFTDRMLGRVLDALAESPYASNTVICLWTDHGWHLGEKQHWRKFALWEEATRTPLIFVAPPGTPGLTQGTAVAASCAQPVSLLDVYPTIVALCGLPPRAGLSGHSLVNLLGNPKAVGSRPALTTHGRENHALRDGRWRYIRYADGSEELYDHATDPMEWTNLAGDEEHADVKARFVKWLPKRNAADAARRRKR